MKEVIIEISSGSQYESKSISLHKVNHQTLDIFESITNEYKIEIFYPKNKVTQRLPDELGIHLINFLILYKPKHIASYCCINFAYEMAYGRDIIKYDNFIDNFFNEKPDSLFNEEKLNIGDIVHLYKKIFGCFNMNHHYAIYLGQGYYLSLFGRVGSLAVTTLDAMKQLYQADICTQCFKLPLKEEKPSHSDSVIGGFFNFFRQSEQSIESAHEVITDSFSLSN